MAIRLSRRKITGYIADQLMSRAQTKEVVTELAAFLIDTRRTNELELIVRDIEYELSTRGLVSATAVSAFSLTDETRQAITRLIAEDTGSQAVQLHEHLDPSVLGGVKIDIPGRQLDATIARRLTTLRTNVKK